MIHHSSAACSVPRGSAGVHAATSQRGVPHHPPHTCTHSTAIRAPTTRTNKHAHERAAPARLPYARRPSLQLLRPSHGLPAARSTVVTQPLPPRTGRSLRRRRAAVIAAGGAAVAAAAAAAAHPFEYAPTIAAAVNKEPVRVERETPTALSASVRRADVDRERATGTRARRAEGELNGGGCRRWRMDGMQRASGRLSKL